MKYLLLIASIVAYGQATINAPAIQLTATGQAAVMDYLNSQRTGVQTKLSEDITASTTTFQVESGQGISVGATLLIDAEHVSVTARTGRSVTVTRGFNGTTAAAHLTDADIRELRYRTMNALAGFWVRNQLRGIVENYPPLNAPIVQAIAERDAAIATVRAAKDAAIQAAVQ